jgi:hypothetical protein
MNGELSLFPSGELVSEGTRATWRKRVDFILEREADLTKAEAAFAKAVQRQLNDGRDLDFGQSRNLNQVFHRLEEALG